MMYKTVILRFLWRDVHGQREPAVNGDGRGRDPYRVPVRRAPSSDRNVSGCEQGLDRQRDGDGGALRIRQRRVPAEDRNGRDGLHVHVRQLRERIAEGLKTYPNKSCLRSAV